MTPGSAPWAGKRAGFCAERGRRQFVWRTSAQIWYNAPMKTYMTVVAALFAAYAVHAAKIEVVQDRDNALYGAGEEVTFKVSVRNDSGELMTSGRAM